MTVVYLFSKLNSKLIQCDDLKTQYLPNLYVNPVWKLGFKPKPNSMNQRTF